MAQSLGANVLRGYSERFYWRVEEEEVIPWDKHEMERPNDRGVAGIGAEGELVSIVSE